MRRATPTVQAGDGLEVAELGGGDGERARRGRPGAARGHEPQRPRSAHRVKGRSTSAAPEMRRSTTARDQPAVSERLGERARRAERRARHEHRDEAESQVPPHRLDHVASFVPRSWSGRVDRHVRSKVC